MSRPKASSPRSSRISGAQSHICAASATSRSCWSNNISTLPASSATISLSWTGARSNTPATAPISMRAKSVGRWRYKGVAPAMAGRAFSQVVWGRMRTEITSATSAIFAANRARGSVKFDVHQLEGVTRRRHLHESGSLRVRFPSPEAEGLSAVLVNTAGGVAGGDRFEIEIAAAEGSRLSVTTAAAEKVYRAQGPAAQVNIALKG